MKFSTALAVLIATMGGTAAFSPPAARFGRIASVILPPSMATGSTSRGPLLMADTDTDVQDEISLSEDESSLVNSLWSQCNQDDTVLQELVLQALPTMSPKLMMKLKQAHNSADESTLKVASALQSVLDERLASGREILATLLSAGEIRKLDAEIGKACRANKLDMAFFTVLDMNLKDATLGEEQETTEQSASRLSILKHIYTRCQEEVEKLVPAGVALLNKLLRTDQDGIRANQLEHYLCPQPDVITLPDGQQIPVKDGERNKVLVPPSELVDALVGTIQQIRTVEKAGGMDREAAANMVESCRTMAKEARVVIGQYYGGDSGELLEFEQSLQPVFRPTSPESEFIQGIQ
mmetsp:Transcript_23169/g.38315  ORF Transcript_23169/g.38315 Transcript_23169/m.38315 type:complete len:351 (-) Transcript_23169:994-2046(-)|eukprot:CAMPEP_0119022040 /NCGR_PEP_ID=MMETSP1176-20130426/27179_1 /TAXON_ID=265551 /ORGANISM="Synedropsis recta cf, Strain CCMP1620" /LENGTH=350 /DNA_ID=CAMNT_0006976773 /DNA_START=76 /DNA_END=1128 /DNA_ORIENTATION=+